MSKVRKVRMSVAAPPQGTSAQPDETADPWTPDGAINPPLNLGQLAGLTKVARLRRSCIAATAHNTVGLGYELEVRDGHEDKIEGEVAEAVREAKERLDALAQRDAMLKRPSFKRLLTTVIWDKYECGNGYIEVARNKIDGTISGLFHAPGKRVRRLKDRTGWIVLNRSGSLDEATRFYDFGQKVAYGDDGQPTGKLANRGLRWQTNELVPLQLYTSESRDYGLPPDSQLANDYLGDKLAGDTNVGFFAASGVPPTVIFVQGEEVEEGTTTKIEVDPEFVQQVTDTMRGAPTVRARVAIIGVPAGFEAQVENMAVTSERDMGFIAYRGDNRRATLGAFRISPVFVADIEDAGKYTAEVERAITKEQVFDPEQDEVQELLEGTILGELMPDLSIVFDELAIKGDEARRESANDLAERGRLTNRELREAHGYGPMPEAAEGAEPKPGEVPAGWNDELVPAAPRSGPPGTPEIPTPSSLAKADDEPPSLEDEIRADFDAHLEDAIRQVHELNPGTAVEPIIVEKVGDKVTISRNGTGS